jgi:hypothetical protein
VGIVDADALPTSEKLSPAAPSTFTAAVLLVRFCFEVCLTRDMVASSVFSGENRQPSVRSANWRGKRNHCHKTRDISNRVPFIFMNFVTRFVRVQHADALTSRADRI